MHEYSVVQALLARVESEQKAGGATSVQRVRVSLGELCGVEPSLFATAYDTSRERTICVNARSRCSTCRHAGRVRAASWRWSAEHHCAARPAGSRRASCKVDELTLESVELDVP